MTGYEYASFIVTMAKELQKEIEVVPVVGSVLREGLVSSRWDHVLCHPTDKGKTDEKEFKYPFRDI